MINTFQQSGIEPVNGAPAFKPTKRMELQILTSNCVMKAWVEVEPSDWRQ
jgi:hypothetical protein